MYIYICTYLHMYEYIYIQAPYDASLMDSEVSWRSLYIYIFTCMYVYMNICMYYIYKPLMMPHRWTRLSLEKGFGSKPEF